MAILGHRRPHANLPPKPTGDSTLPGRNKSPADGYPAFGSFGIRDGHWRYETMIVEDPDGNELFFPYPARDSDAA